MDGNRRWATKQKLEKKEGHIFGYKALERSLEWYNQLGIEQVTVFTFSIENYKRPAAEVNTIMKLACEKFDEMVLKKSTIERNQCKIQIMGNVSLLPEQVRRSVFNVVKMTSQHTKVKLNMCFSYTSTDEISQALETVIQNCSRPKPSLPSTTIPSLQQQATSSPISSSSSSFSSLQSTSSSLPSNQELKNETVAPHITLDDVTPALLGSCMYCPDDPDIVIRTSGETRLSEFLLWQSASTVLNFLSVLWPDFSVWHLCTSILQYQYSYPEIQKRKQLFKQLEEQYTNSTANPSEERTAKFVSWKRDVDFNTLKPKVQS